MRVHQLSEHCRECGVELVEGERDLCNQCKSYTCCKKCGREIQAETNPLCAGCFYREVMEHTHAV